jgi:hypothetical protein
MRCWRRRLSVVRQQNHMALFPKEQSVDSLALGDAPRRMLWTREQGTRKLLLVLAIVCVIWFGASKILDQVLLSKHWAPLQPTLDGLTVVGTLNARGQYDRNLLKIVTANKSERVELTDFGWNSIFDPRNGSLCSDHTSAAVEKAREVDSVAGDALLEPFLRAAVQREMGDPNAFQRLKPDDAVQIAADPESKKGGARATTISELIRRFADDPGNTAVQADTDSSEGGSGSGRQAEHGVSLTADTVAKVCPVVLTGSMFSDGWVEEQPGNVFTSKAFTVHLTLTSEGRSRFFQWSHNHANESMVFVLQHRIVLAGQVPQTLDVNELDIRNVEDEQAARQVVDWITKRKQTDS